MVSFLSQLNPTPGFPSYTGPYKVGSTDVEIPTSELPSPSPTPDPSISTVSFRIFYPSEPPVKHSKPVYWLPEPQQEYLGAYKSTFSPSPCLHNITGGTQREASAGKYGDKKMAGHAPDHRDGSSPLSCIREKPGSDPRYVEYRSISHQQSPEVEQARDDQLKIRLWELGLVHEALLKIDRGEPLTNTLEDTPADATRNLGMFTSSLDVHSPGSISWSGHSFGAASVVQFVKSAFYHTAKGAPTSYEPLYQPSASSQIAHQITPSTPVFLLDLWCLPLLSRLTRWLHDLPLPCYARGGPGGGNLLAILSEAFFKWNNNLIELKRTVSENPSSGTPENKTHPAPYIFYPASSAHLSQSDFGILFPWFTKKAFKAQDPDRTLRLNTRAILEVMRRNAIEVADTSAIDMEESAAGTEKPVAHIGQDAKILKGDGNVTGWVSLDLGKSAYAEEAVNRRTSENADPMDAVVQGEMRKSTSS
ncbi:MAG: hypothetical protein Q9207_007040 [Kuettlingeria erythrocarpa]